MISKAKLTAIRLAMQEAIKNVETDHSVVIRVIGAHYGYKGDIKFEVVSLNSPESVIDPDAYSFKTFAKTYGMEPEWLGKTFMHQGKTFRITGLKSNRPKFPVSATCVTDGPSYNRAFKFPAYSVVGAMRPKSPAVTVPLGRDGK